jgi:hypothetical protein
VLAPDGQHVAHRPAAHVDRVLGQQVLERVDPIAGEMKQRQDAGLARPGGEALKEPRGLLAGVAAGRRQKADPRHFLAGQGQDQPVQGWAALLHGEATTAHGQDPAGVIG